MKTRLLLLSTAALIFASCSTTIERNATAFGGGWGMKSESSPSTHEEQSVSDLSHKQTKEEPSVQTKSTLTTVTEPSVEAVKASNFKTDDLYKTKEFKELNVVQKLVVQKAVKKIQKQAKEVNTHGQNTLFTFEKDNAKSGKQADEKGILRAGVKSTNSILRLFKRKIENVKTRANAVASNEGGMGYSITSLVLGIVGLFGLGILLGPLAMIFGAIGLGRDGKGMAIAGLVLGIIEFLISLFLLLTILAQMSL